MRGRWIDAVMVVAFLSCAALRAGAQVDGRWIEFGAGQGTSIPLFGTPNSNFFAWRGEDGRPVLACGLNAPSSQGYFILEWDGLGWSRRRLQGVDFIEVGTRYGEALAYRGYYRGSDGQSLRGIWLWRNGSATAIHTPDLFVQPRAMIEYRGRLMVGGPPLSVNIGVHGSVVAWDGQSWSSFANADGVVESLTVWNDQLIAAGNFTMIDSIPALNIAAWDGFGWRHIALETPPITAMAVHRGALYALSSTTFPATGASMARLNEIDGSGVWSPVPMGPAASVGALTKIASFQDRLIVYGGFSSIRNEGQLDIPARSVASWDGETWLPLGGGFNGKVYALATHQGSLYVGGEFTIAGNERAHRLARWDGRDIHPVGAGIGTPSLSLITTELVRSLFSIDSGLVAAGPFVRVGGVETGPLVRWDGQAWERFGDLSSIWGQPYTPNFVTRAGGTLFGYGPAFGNLGNLYRHEGDRWVVEATNVNAIRGMVEYQGDLVIAGWFTSVNSVPARLVARRTASGWVSMGEGLDGPLGVFSAAVFRDEIYASGWIRAANGVPTNTARWDGQRWVPLPFLSQGASVLKVYGGELIAAGRSPIYNVGDQYSCVARWNGRSWRPLAQGLRGEAYSLAVYKGELFVGGTFDPPFDSPEEWHLARWTRCLADVDDGTGEGVADGGVTIDDLLYFLGEYARGAMEADLDDGAGEGTPDGGVTIDDLLYYLARYELGC